MDFRKNAIRGAVKLCGRTKQCICSCECDHKNHSASISLKPLIEGAVCPLAKYNIKPEDNLPSWWEAKRGYFEPNEEELFALCASCDNGKIVEDEGFLTIEPKDFIVCFDCPVHGYIECRDEAAAEAACS